MQHRTAPHPALLIVDMQAGLFDAPEPPFERDRILDNINALIAAARAAGAPIFAARHTGPAGSPLEPGSPATRLVAGLGIDAARDRVFDKTRPSCFTGTALAQELAALGVNELVVAGMKTQYCIDTTCRAAADLGLAVVLAADAHTTTDSPVLPARSIIDHHNATLAGPFARIVKTADYAFGSARASM